MTRRKISDAEVIQGLNQLADYFERMLVASGGKDVRLVSDLTAIGLLVLKNLFMLYEEAEWVAEHLRQDGEFGPSQLDQSIMDFIVYQCKKMQLLPFSYSGPILSEKSDRKRKKRKRVVGPKDVQQVDERTPAEIEAAANGFVNQPTRPVYDDQTKSLVIRALAVYNEQNPSNRKKLRDVMEHFFAECKCAGCEEKRQRGFLQTYGNNCVLLFYPPELDDVNFAKPGKEKHLYEDGCPCHNCRAARIVSPNFLSNTSSLAAGQKTWNQ